jgi:Flp pilus assembly pilin Flp
MGTAISHFVKSSPAVEHGFLAAGITITVVCVVQSIAIILGWFA